MYRALYIFKTDEGIRGAGVLLPPISYSDLSEMDRDKCWSPSCYPNNIASETQPIRVSMVNLKGFAIIYQSWDDCPEVSIPFCSDCIENLPKLVFIPDDIESTLSECTFTSHKCYPIQDVITNILNEEE